MHRRDRVDLTLFADGHKPVTGEPDMSGWTATSRSWVLSRWRFKLLWPGMKNGVEIIEFESDHDAVTRYSGFRPIAKPKWRDTELMDARVTYSTAPGQDLLPKNRK